jgi:hypothetical protein
MKKLSKRISQGLVAGSLCLLVGGMAFADRRHEDKLEKYVATGEMKTCLSTTRISRTDVVDDTAILFEMRNKDVYLNRLRSTCHGLRMQGAFGYKLSSNRLCKGEIITVLDQNHMGASCSLGKFELLKEVEDEG